MRIASREPLWAKQNERAKDERSTRRATNWKKELRRSSTNWNNVTSREPVSRDVYCAICDCAANSFRCRWMKSIIKCIDTIADTKHHASARAFAVRSAAHSFATLAIASRLIAFKHMTAINLLDVFNDENNWTLAPHSADGNEKCRKKENKCIFFLSFGEQSLARSSLQRSPIHFCCKLSNEIKSDFSSCVLKSKSGKCYVHRCRDARPKQAPSAAH